MSLLRSVGGVVLAGTFALTIGLPVAAATPTATPTVGEGLVGIPWVLERLVVDTTLTDVPAGVVTTLLLEDGEASGTGGCNSYAGPYILKGDALAFGTLLSTMMLCPDPQEATERAYLDALGRVSSYALDRNGLTLLDKDGQSLLVFTATAAPSMTGGWIVTSYRSSGRNHAAPLEASLLTAAFEPDGALEGSSGCNHFSGSYTVHGDDIAIGPLSSTRLACATPDLQTQETEYLAALVASNKWSQDGVDLDLLDSSGAGKEATVKLTAESEPSYLGEWTVTGYDRGNGSVVAPVAGSTLSAVFSLDGTLAGDSGCNAFSGPYTVSTWSMTIGPLASSRAACPSAELNTQEQQYQAALQSVTSWATDADGIVLRGTDGATLVTLSPAAK